MEYNPNQEKRTNRNNYSAIEYCKNRLNTRWNKLTCPTIQIVRPDCIIDLMDDYDQVSDYRMNRMT
jgi:hypothetical protein